MVEDILNGPPTLLRRAYKLANNPDKYIYGVPKYKFLSESGMYTQFRQYLELTYPTIDSIEYTHISTIHYRHLFWSLITHSYGYDESSNIIADSPLGLPVYVLDTLPVLNGLLPDSGDPNEPNIYVFPDEDTYVDWETPAIERPNPFNIEDPLDSEDIAVEVSEDGDSGIVAALAWEDPQYLFGSKVCQSTVFLGMREEGDNKDDSAYFYAKYYINGEPTYFTYDPDTEDISYLNDIIDDTGTESDGFFMPFIHLKVQESYVNSDKDSREYLDSVRLGNMVGVEIDDFIDSLKEDDGHTYIQDAAVLFATSLNSERHEEQKYIYHFFEWLYSRTSNTSTGKNSISINDAALGFSLSWSPMTREVVQGSPLKPGKYGVERITTTHEKFIRTKYGARIQYYYTYRLRVRHQISEETYIELIIPNLVSTYRSRDRNVTSSLSDFEDEDDFTMLLPISRTLVEDNFKFIDRETIYYQSLSTLITTYQKVKVKWYQRSWVGTFLKVFAVVIAVVSLGTAIKGSMGLVALAGGLSASVALGVAVTLIKHYIVGLIISYGYRVVLEEIGADWALALAILAIAAGGTRMIQQGKISDKLALNLVGQATTIANVQNQITQDQLSSVLKEIEENRKVYIDELKRIQEMIEDLRPDRELSLSTVMGMSESVDEYLTRLNMSADSIEHALRVIPNYVDIMLRLPEEDVSNGR